MADIATANGSGGKPKMFSDLADVRRRHAKHFELNLVRRTLVIGSIIAAIALFIFGFWFLEFSFQRIWNGLGNLGTFVKLMFPPTYGTEARLWLYLTSLGETLAIAFLGTILAALIAFPLSFLAARNVMPMWPVRFIFSRSFDTLRSVETLIWALIWINVVGLGPFAGVLAIMTADIGALSKLFSEAIETVDKKPIEGVTASGSGAAGRIRYGVIPSVLPVMASQVLYYIESNTRSATIIGIVGAGGIGQHLSEQIRTLEWQHVSFLIIMILIAVAIIDWISSRLRLAMIGKRAT